MGKLLVFLVLLPFLVIPASATKNEYHIDIRQIKLFDKNKIKSDLDYMLEATIFELNKVLKRGNHYEIGSFLHLLKSDPDDRYLFKELGRAIAKQDEINKNKEISNLLVIATEEYKKETIIPLEETINEFNEAFVKADAEALKKILNGIIKKNNPYVIEGMIFFIVDRHDFRGNKTFSNFLKIAGEQISAENYEEKYKRYGDVRLKARLLEFSDLLKKNISYQLRDFFADTLAEGNSYVIEGLAKEAIKQNKKKENLTLLSFIQEAAIFNIRTAFKDHQKRRKGGAGLVGAILEFNDTVKDADLKRIEKYFKNLESKYGSHTVPRMIQVATEADDKNVNKTLYKIFNSNDSLSRRIRKCVESYSF